MSDEVPKNVFVSVGFTEEHGLTVKCRHCGALGPLPRPGQRPEVEHKAGCIGPALLDSRRLDGES